MATKSKVVAVRLPDGPASDLAQACDVTGKTQAELVTQCIQKALPEVVKAHLDAQQEIINAYKKAQKLKGK